MFVYSWVDVVLLVLIAVCIVWGVVLYFRDWVRKMAAGFKD